MNRADERSIREKIEDLAREEYEKLKSESTTYGELKERMHRIASHIGWATLNGAVYTSLLEQEFERFFKEDLSIISCARTEDQNHRKKIQDDYNALKKRQEEKERKTKKLIRAITIAASSLAIILSVISILLKIL